MLTTYRTQMNSCPARDKAVVRGRQLLAIVALVCAAWLSAGCAGGGASAARPAISGPAGTVAFVVTGSGYIEFTISHYRNGKPVRVGKCKPHEEALRVPMPEGVHQFVVMPTKGGPSGLITVRVMDRKPTVVVITSNTGRSIADKGRVAGHWWEAVALPPGTLPPMR